MKKSNIALRPQHSLPEDAKKLAAIRTETYFRERAARANPAKALEVLARAGKGTPPEPGDEL